MNEHQLKLEALSAKIKKMKNRVCLLTKLNEKIRENNLFTHEEQSNIQNMLKTSSSELVSNEELLSQMTDLYYNKIEFLQHTLDCRLNIINEFLSANSGFEFEETADICNVFAETQDSLTEELKKSQIILEQ